MPTLPPPSHVEYQTLVDRLERASLAYYNDDPSGDQITDAQFDALVDELRGIDPAHPFLSTVGAPPPVMAKKAKHTIPMMSLNKVTTRMEVEKWFDTLRTKIVTVQPKLDGSSIALQYRGGKLVQAITRGDGEEGEIVTHIFRKIPDVPQTVLWTKDVTVRGEAVLSVKNWQRIGGKNPRNVGNGIVQRDDGVNAELLSFRAFDVQVKDDDDTTTAKIQAIMDQGFQTIPTWVAHSVDEIMEHIEEINANRDLIPFWIDGAVVTANDPSDRTRLGVASKRPKYAFAFKWESANAVTVLRQIEVSVGSTGMIAPTGIVDPVELNGTTVGRVYLKNYDEIARLGIAVGDSITLHKANEIVPECLGYDHRPDNRVLIVPPTHCPICGAPTARQVTLHSEDGGVILVCTGTNCQGKRIGKVKRWITSRNILGIGDGLLEAMVGTVVDDPADLYRLKYHDLSQLKVGNGVLGVVRAQAIIAEIDKSREATIDDFLGSLGITYLGKRKVQIIRELAGGALNMVRDWTDGKTLLELAAQCQIPNVAAVINQELTDPSMNSLIRDLEQELRLQTQEPKQTNLDKALDTMKPLNDKHIAITGTLSRKRAEIIEIIEAAGGTFDDGVKGTTNVLVAADPNSGSSKLQSATKRGVQVISEEQLMAMIG